MAISHEIEDWLENSGYKYHCFISGPHSKHRGMKKFALRLREDITEELNLRGGFYDPQVFLDEKNINLADDWEREISDSLCKSIAMVSLCGPLYYHPKHEWCGLEWAAMSSLGKKRIKSSKFGTILPLILVEDERIPGVVSKTQFLDFSAVFARSRNPYLTQDYREKVIKIVDRIIEIAQALEKNKAVPSCDKFKIPAASAFTTHKPAEKHLPIPEHLNE